MGKFYELQLKFINKIREGEIMGKFFTRLMRKIFLKITNLEKPAAGKGKPTDFSPLRQKRKEKKKVPWERHI